MVVFRGGGSFWWTQAGELHETYAMTAWSQRLFDEVGTPKKRQPTWPVAGIFEYWLLPPVRQTQHINPQDFCNLCVVVMTVDQMTDIQSVCRAPAGDIIIVLSKCVDNYYRRSCKFHIKTKVTIHGIYSSRYKRQEGNSVSKNDPLFLPGSENRMEHK